MPVLIRVTRSDNKRQVTINFANVMSYFAHDRKIDKAPDVKGAKPTHAWVNLVTGDQVPVMETVEQIEKQLPNTTQP